MSDDDNFNHHIPSLNTSSQSVAFCYHAIWFEHPWHDEFCINLKKLNIEKSNDQSNSNKMYFKATEQKC